MCMCMAGNFRGVLNFVIFVVDLVVTKVPSMKINACMAKCVLVHMETAGGMAKTLWKHALTTVFSARNCNCCYCRPANGVLDSVMLSHGIVICSKFLSKVTW